MLTDYDVAWVRLWPLSSWTGILIYDQVQVLIMRASSILEIERGKKHFVNESSHSRAGTEECSRVTSSFVSDGWRPLDDGRSGLLIKDTEVPPNAVVPIPARLKYLDELLRAKKIDDSAVQAFQDALMQLETLEGPTTRVVGVELVELLERLTELHLGGSLSDEEFLQAKKKALGM